MDWCAWLSKTNLDAALIYEYALAFVRNELQEEDLPFFNHDFLQSLGISIAKHRLEILKLCRKDSRRGAAAAANGGLSRLVLVVNKTRKLFARNISKLGFQKASPPPDMPSPYRSQWGRRRVGMGGRSVTWSGPIDRRLTAAAGGGCQSLQQSVSGPLDWRVQERIVYPNPNRSPMVGRPGLGCRSPTISGPIERFGLSPKVGLYVDHHVHENGAQSLWSIMFQDMKPT